MKTITIGNVSTTDTLLASVLPKLFQLNGDIAPSSSKEYAFSDHDLDMVEDQHTGFTSRELLLQLKQLNVITMVIPESNVLPVFDNVGRPDPTTQNAGTEIWNSDDAAPNYSDGLNWRDSGGSIT